MNRDKGYRVDPELRQESDTDVDLFVDDEFEADEEGGAFHDPVLRRALAHAPDHAVLPMDETRESITAFAHEAVAPSLAAAPVWAQRSFVQRVLGMRGGAGFGAHIPWNGLVAIALAGVAVVVQDPELMEDIQKKVMRREAAAPAVANVPATVVPAAPATPTAPAENIAAVASVTQAQAQAQATQPAAPPSAAVASPPTLPAPAASAAPAQASAPIAPVATAPAVPPPLAPSAATPSTPTIATPSVESPADAAARAVLAQKLQRLEAAEAKARLSQHSDAGGLPSNLFSGALPRTAIPVEVPLASRTGKAGLAPGASSAAAGTASPARVEDSPQPTFTALSQWTRLTITSAAGETRRIARADAGELGPLVGSTALAGVGPQPLSGRVDWRVAFERNGEQLGMLELAGTQIRWKENGFPAGTGAPPASGLASLRQALKEVHAEPVKSAEPPPLAAPVAPPGAEPAQ